MSIPIVFRDVGERKLLGPKVIQQTSEKFVVIRNHLSATQNWQKSYVNTRRRKLEFEVGDHVFPRMSPTKGVTRFGVYGKLSPHYV